jgi:hypothetical protein
MLGIPSSVLTLGVRYGPLCDFFGSNAIVMSTQVETTSLRSFFIQLHSTFTHGKTLPWKFIESSSCALAWIFDNHRDEDSACLVLLTHQDQLIASGKNNTSLLIFESPDSNLLYAGQLDSGRRGLIKPSFSLRKCTQRVRWDFHHMP